MPNFKVAENSALLANNERGGLLGGETGLDLSADAEDRVERSSAVLDLGRGIAESVESGLTFPGDVFTGEANPADTSRMMDLLGIVSGPGAIAAKPGAVGMLGGKVVSKARKVIDADKLEKELQTQFIEAVKVTGKVSEKNRNLIFLNARVDKQDFFKFGNIGGRTTLEITPNQAISKKGNTLNMRVDFDTKRLQDTVENLKFSEVKSNQKVLNHVFDTVDKAITQTRPEVIQFVASTPKLVKPYIRAADKLAKKHNGIVTHHKAKFADNLAFSIKFPNPRHYKVE